MHLDNIESSGNPDACLMVVCLAEGKQSDLYAGLPYFGETDSVESSAQNASSPNGQSALPGNAFHTADGSHLDALVPMRVNGCLGRLLHYDCCNFQLCSSDLALLLCNLPRKVF